MPERPLFFVVAGEASGDIHAANLIREMCRLCPDARFAGLGGRRMEQAGCELLYNLAEKLSVMGFFSVFTNLGRILEARRIALEFIDAERPDLVILIDFPGFNLHLAGKLRERRVRVAYYILPQVWAWSSGRWRKLRDRTQQRLVILPFEESWYAARPLDVDYVGHPLYDHLASQSIPDDLRQRIAAGPGEKLLGLLPGSRRQEFLKKLPVMLKSARLILDAFPATRVLISPVPGLSEEAIQGEAERFGVPLTILPDATYTIMKHADLCLVASGTATLELAFFETPMIVLYRVSWVQRILGGILLRVPHIALVNLIAQREVVPEFLLWHDDKKAIAETAIHILSSNTVRKEMIEGMREVNRRMLAAPGATSRAARLLAAPFAGGNAAHCH